MYQKRADTPLKKQNNQPIFIAIYSKILSDLDW